jgi:hypothetical protein
MPFFTAATQMDILAPAARGHPCPRRHGASLQELARQNRAILHRPHHPPLAKYLRAAGAAASHSRYLFVGGSAWRSGGSR